MKPDIFNRYKHIKIEVENLIVFPDGAGGNFLLSMADISQDDVSNNNTNEYKADEMFWPDIDSLRFHNHRVPAPSISEIEKNVETWLSVHDTKLLVDRYGKFEYLVGHFPPKILCDVFDVTIKDALWIQPHSVYTEITDTIHRFKKVMFRDYNANPYMISDILNGIKTKNNTLKINSNDHDIALAMLRKTLPLVEKNSLIVWKFIIDSKIKNDNMTANDARKYITEYFFDSAFKRRSYGELYMSDSYKTKFEQVTSKCQNIHVVPYDKLFFDLELPEIGPLDPNNADILFKIARYSRKNLDMLSFLNSKTLTEYDAYHYVTSFSRDAVSRLESACKMHNISI